MLDHGAVFDGVFFYEADQFGVSDVLLPRNVGADFSQTLTYAVHTNLLRKIEGNHRVARTEPHLVCAAEIAVDNPTVLPNDFGKFVVKLFARNMRPVRLPPQIVEVKKRQPRFGVEFLGKGAFAAA